MDADAEFDFAAGVLQGGGAAEGQPAHANDEMDVALAMLAPARPRPIGFPRRSAATAAFARVSRALKAEQDKVADLRTRFDNLVSRRSKRHPPNACVCWGAIGCLFCFATH